MKRKSILYLFTLLSFVATSFLTSCQDDEATPALKIDLLNESGYVSEDTTVAPETSFKVKWKVDKADKNLATFTIQAGNTPVAGFNPKTLSGAQKDSYTDEVVLQAPATEGEYTYTFTVADNDNVTSSTTLRITVASNINTYTTVLLGNQKNATDPSFYATTTNTRYNLANAKNNSDKVDFGYGNGSSLGNEYFIGSPDDASMIDVYGAGTNGISSWTKKNHTTFVVTSLTTTQFDAIISDEDLVSAVSGGTTSFTNTRVRGNEMAPDKVVGFTTEAGKKGLIKIVQRSGSADVSGSVTIVVKVQK